MYCHRLRHSLICVLLTVASLGTVAHADDLLTVYRQAQDNDALWAQARAVHAANLEKGPQGRALLLPSVSLAAGYSKLDQEVTRTGVTTNDRYSNEGYSVQLTQPLYRKQNLAGYAQGQAGVAQAEADLAQARQALIQRVANAYFDVLFAHDVLAFAGSEKAAVQRQLALARRNFAVGSATLVDVHDAQARFDVVSAQEITAANDLTLRAEALRLIIRRAPGALARPAATLPLETPDPPDIEQWVTTATANNAAIAAKEQVLTIAQEEVEKARGGHYPTLDLTASRAYNDAGGSVFGIATESTTNQVGVQLQVPLYAGGATASKVREALARRDEARDSLEQTRREVARQTRDAYLAVTTGIARVRALELALTSNRRALESTLIGYESGVRNGTDVLAAQRVLYATQRDLADARYSYIKSRLRLKAAAGTLNDDDLARVNDLLAGG